MHTTSFDFPPQLWGSLGQHIVSISLACFEKLSFVVWLARA
ncbi:MAG: hypothetical protein ACKERG_01110 [Candidatus Hodgkinia cicadicola]